MSRERTEQDAADPRNARSASSSPPNAAQVTRSGSLWTVSGTVVHGDRRGRTLGFPTANLLLSADDGVEDGVWAAEVAVAGQAHVAAVSIGHRPTYYDRRGPRLLEAHLLDFSGDLYGQRMLVVLREHLRSQRAFTASVELVRQMHDDLTRVRDWNRRERERRARGSAPWSAPRDPQQLASARRVRHDRLVEAAARDALAVGALDHAEVARRAGIPLGYVQWAYPAFDDLLRAARRGIRAHGPA